MVQGKQKQKQCFVALGSGYLLKNTQNKVYLITISVLFKEQKNSGLYMWTRKMISWYKSVVLETKKNSIKLAAESASTENKENVIKPLWFQKIIV